MANSYFLAGAYRRCASHQEETPSLLRHMLSEAEKLYGARDRNFTISGLGFNDSDPHIWYLGQCGCVALRLSELAAESQADHVYQLAHECIHFLSPCTWHPVSVLEEGLATVFAEDFTRRFFPSYERPQLPSFREAARYVRELLTQAPEAIVALRAVEGAFYRMGPSTFAMAGLDHVTRGLRETLLSRFEYA